SDRGTNPGDAVDRRRQPDRSAGVGPDCGAAFASRHGGAGSSARSGGKPPRIPWISRRTVVGVVGGAAPGELVHVGLADEDGAGGAEPRRDRRVLLGDEVGEDLRAGGGAHAPRVEVVLEGDRDAMERSQMVTGG